MIAAMLAPPGSRNMSSTLDCFDDCGAFLKGALLSATVRTARFTVDLRFVLDELLLEREADFAACAAAPLCLRRFVGFVASGFLIGIFLSAQATASGAATDATRQPKGRDGAKFKRKGGATQPPP